MIHLDLTVTLRILKDTEDTEDTEGLKGQKEGIGINSKYEGLRWERAELVHGTEGPLSWSSEDKV